MRNVGAQRGSSTKFENYKALDGYAEQNGLAYVWEGTTAFTKRAHKLLPEQFEVCEVRTKRGSRRVLLFSKAILRAEFEPDAPSRKATAIKRAQSAVKREEAKQERRAAERALKKR